MTRKPDRFSGLPTREQILAFIEESDQPADKRAIARAFGLKGQEKVQLKSLLRDMTDEGLVDLAPGRAFAKMGGVPKVTVLRVVGIDDDQVIAVPESWEADKPPPRIRVQEKKGGKGALGVGDRVLARTEERGKGLVASVMKKLARAEEMVLGVVTEQEDQGGKGGSAPRMWLRAVDKKARRDWAIADLGDAKPGDLVLTEVSGRPPKQSVRVVRVVGDPLAPRSLSEIAIHKYGIPHEFPDAAIEQAELVAKLPLGEAREDLRDVPIVAIDPADARDHDDAIWAEPDTDPKNTGGFRAIVAIADVSFYVRPGSALDREARKRGNSVYFPDQVVPMLPEILSADVCSLKEGQDRAAMACHLQISAKGKLLSWRFTRATVRLAANIAYEDAQAAIDGDKRHELTDSVLRPLWDAWGALKAARDAREPLELDLPERRIELDETGRIMSVAVRERLDAHRVVEDFMIAANVAAAKALEARKSAVMYRIHEVPSREKLVALKDYMESVGGAFALGQVVKPATFNRLLEGIDDDTLKAQVMEQVLRSQTQAYYGPANLGHFGLALGSYAHFTSPIRRYADLLVHRALVDAYKLTEPKPHDKDIPAKSGLSADDRHDLGRIGQAISDAERRAMQAERETVDRYVAAYLAERVGEIVRARITGVLNFGFFATVDGIGGDGLVPVSTLGSEYFDYDENAQTLRGQQTGTSFEPGQMIDLRLIEADPIKGSLMFELPDAPARGGRGADRGGGGRQGRGRGGGGPKGGRGSGAPKTGKADPSKPKRKPNKRGRPANIKHSNKKR